MNRDTSGQLKTGLILLLIFAIGITYSQVWSFGFVWDDILYVTQHPRTLEGLNRNSLGWAFTCIDDGNYLPITWLSHSLCVSLFGTHPAGHHLFNLLLHITNSVLLFHFLHLTTGRIGPSAAVALLFGLHPMHVESVAWISERKDVLSTLFWLLALLAYARYVRSPEWKTYVLVVALFLLGLLSKSMLVTLPITLLLLDFWPLGRLGPNQAPSRYQLGTLLKLVREKIPLFVLSIVFGSLTFWAQRHYGTMDTTGTVSIWARFGNALSGIFKYLELLFLPVQLSPYYPLRTGTVLWMKSVFILILLLSILVFSWLQIKKRPFLFMGWSWYIITILPVAGLIQVGGQAYADRYTYVPYIGLFIAVTWIAGELLLRVSPPRMVVICSLASILALLMSLSFVQASRWKDNTTLWGHAITVDPRNERAYCNLGAAFEAEGKNAEAIASLAKSIELDPNQYLPYYNLGLVLEKIGKTDEAIACFKRASRLSRDSVLSDYRAAYLLVQKGAFIQASPHLKRILEASPRRIGPDPKQQKLVLGVSHMCMGLLARSQGDLRGALDMLRRSTEENPGYAWAHFHLGSLLEALGRDREALLHLERCAEAEPDNPFFALQLAKAYGRCGRLDDSVRTLNRLQQRFPDSPAAVEARMEIARLGKTGPRPPSGPVLP